MINIIIVVVIAALVLLVVAVPTIRRQVLGSLANIVANVAIRIIILIAAVGIVAGICIAGQSG